MDRRYRPVLAVALLAPALLVGAFERHSTAGVHSPLATPAPVAVAAVHPGAATHVEATALEPGERCPDCLLRLQTACGGLPLLRRLPGPEPRSGFAAPAAAVPCRRPLAERSGRSPPLA